MKSILINTAILAGLLIAMAYVGPAMDNEGPAEEVAREELAKQQREERFARAAQEVCGLNAAWRLTHRQGEVVCLTKRGHKTKVASL